MTYRNDLESLEEPLDPDDIWLPTLPMTTVFTSDVKFRPAKGALYIACRLFEVTIPAQTGIEHPITVRVGQELNRSPIGLSQPLAVNPVTEKAFTVTHNHEQYSLLIV
jgi:hypothetical protein